MIVRNTGSGNAPTWRWIIFPFATNNMVGIPWTPYFIAHSGFSSVFTFATIILPAFSLAIFSRVGAIILQGPHQGAQKSTITGTLELNTVFSNAASVT